MTDSFLPLKRLFDIMDYLVDEHVGVIRYVEELRREAGAPDFFHFYAQACDTRALGQNKNYAEAGGASAERGTALAKAIGEAVERYCSAFYRFEELPLTSFESAPFRCVSPEDFALYSEKQYREPNFPYVPFERSTLLRWMPVLDAKTCEEWYLPAAMVFMPYYFDLEHGESPIAQRISTGLACHCSFAEAAASAICEVIERDAFTITWQARLSRPHIRLDSLSETNRDLVKRFERTGRSVVLLNITTDVGIPTVLTVVHGSERDAAALVFAASANADPELAARKSLEEIAHTWRLAQQLRNKVPPLNPGSYYENVRSQDDHVHLYCDPSSASLADFLFSSKESISFTEIENCATGVPEQDLKGLIEKVTAVGNKVLLADLTTPDIEELGLKVVRAVIPGFHPLFIGHRIRALGGSRLWEVPQKLGCRGITRDSGDNPAPHPYP